MKSKGIRAVIEKVLSEETEYIAGDGRVDRVTIEEAIVRTVTKRALDIRNRLGMEATRFLVEYKDGRPPQEMVLSRKYDDEYADVSDEELRAAEERLLKGALIGDSTRTQTDPSRFIEEGRRGEIIQALSESGRKRGTGFGKARIAERRGLVEEIREENETKDGEAGWETDEEMLRGPWESR